MQILGMPLSPDLGSLVIFLTCSNCTGRRGVLLNVLLWPFPQSRRLNDLDSLRLYLRPRYRDSNLEYVKQQWRVKMEDAPLLLPLPDRKRRQAGLDLPQRKNGPNEAG